MTGPELKQEILKLVGQYAQLAHATPPFKPGESAVPVSGKVYDAAELKNLVDSALEFWLTTGRFAHQFEQRFADRIGVRHCLLVNSGSSANLVALSALTSPQLGDRRLKPGDEVITAAAGFPTTINPIIQNQLIPVLLDSHLPTYNIDPEALEKALSPKTKAIMAAHTLGNPFHLDRLASFAKQHRLWLIEDMCDAVGARYQGKNVGTFGDLATVSFYPAHHMTMGEGGAVLTNSPALKKLVESFRDWGRDCWCETGVSDTCGKRFGWQLGDLPFGYDHKYTYSHIGYNLKLTDMQAAVGVAQLDKLDGFIRIRNEHFQRLHDGLKPFEKFFILPQSVPDGQPSWFGFPLSVKPDSGITRQALTAHLESKKIATRQLFAGNITRQPYFKGVAHRTVGNLPNADFIMNHSFWIGVYPGLSHAMIDYMIDQISAFLSPHRTGRP